MPEEASLPPPEGRSLVRKLVEVMALVKRIPKRGYNSHHLYAYAMELDIIEAIREGLVTRNILLTPSVDKVERVGDLTTIEETFTFIDADSGETLARTWAGAGSDKQDKGLYKAMTGGEKYFLMKFFLMPTGGDDPEEADADQRPARQQQRPRPKEEAPSRPREQAVQSAKPNEKITPDMVARLKVMIDHHGTTQKVIGGWMRETYKVGKFSDILRKDYDAICQHVQNSAADVTAEDIPFAGR